MFPRISVTSWFWQSAAGMGDDKSLDTVPSYPITISAGEVREFSKLSIDIDKLKLQGDGIAVVPISIESGVTGVVLIGNGKYSNAPEDGTNLKGGSEQRCCDSIRRMRIRLLRLSNGKTEADKGAAELAEHIVAATFRHCYHRGMDALVPAEKAIAATLYSQEIGDVLISITDKDSVVYNFTNQAKLYKKKK